MKKLKTLTALFVLALVPLVPLNAYDMNNVIAYPVPFNPVKGTLKIANPDSYIIEVNIYDINGDLVCTKTGNVNPVIWNGRDSSGRYVKPGLYIIKVTAENSSGDYGKKTIRILVDY